MATRKKPLTLQKRGPMFEKQRRQPSRFGASWTCVAAYRERVLAVSASYRPVDGAPLSDQGLADLEVIFDSAVADICGRDSISVAVLEGHVTGVLRPQAEKYAHAANNETLTEACYRHAADMGTEDWEFEGVLAITVDY